MLKEFIPQLLMIISAAAVLFLVGRKAISSIKNLDKKELENRTKSLEDLGPEKMKERLFKGLEKMLRKVKIIALQGDTKIMEIIKRLRLKREEGKTVVDEKKNLDEAVEEGKKDKKSILERVSKIKKKLASSGNLVKVDSLKKQVVVNPLKPKTVSSESVNVEEVKKVMLEREEKALIRKISLDHGDDDAYVKLGKLYRDSNNLKDARASFNQALKINKGNVAAKKFLKELRG